MARRGSAALLSRAAGQPAGPRCRDALGRANSSAVVARSAMRPAYITATRSQVCATTPRSWVTSRMLMANSRRRSSSSLRIWSWMVTSSAVVGSSAMSRLGSAGKGHGDHHPLPHAAGEFMRPGVHPPCRRGHADAAPDRRMVSARTCLRGEVVMAADRLVDLIADPHRRVERGHRILEHHGDARAADLSDSAVAELRQVGALEDDRAALDAGRRAAEQANDRAAGDRLAATALADQAEDLAAADIERDAVDGAQLAIAVAENGHQIGDGAEGFPSPSALRPQQTVEPIADQGEGDSGIDDGKAGKGRDPPIIEDEVAARRRS